MIYLAKLAGVVYILHYFQKKTEQTSEREGLTQTAAAGLFSVAQPRVSDLVHGRISPFSIDALIDMAATAGLSPRVTFSPGKRSTGRKTSAGRVAAA